MCVCGWKSLTIHKLTPLALHIYDVSLGHICIHKIAMHCVRHEELYEEHGVENSHHRWVKKDEVK